MITELETTLEGMDLGPLLGLWLQSSIIGVTMGLMGIVIFVLVYGRMMEIYCASRSAASSKGGVRAFWEPGFSKPVKKSIKDVKNVTLASSDLPRRETTRGTIAYRKNRKLGKPSTHD